MNLSQLYKSKTRLMRILKIVGVLAAALVIAALFARPAPAQVPIPWMVAFPDYDVVEAWEWPEGIPITLTIDTAPGLEWSGVSYPTNPGDSRPYFLFELTGQHNLQAGDVVSLTDGTTVRSHTVINTQVTTVDVDANLIAGTTEPGRMIEVWPHANGQTVNAVVDEAGNWTADFNGVYDVGYSDAGRTHTYDEDGDATGVDWFAPPNPWMIAFPESEAIEAWEWPEGAVVSMTIDNAPDLLMTGTAQITDWGDPRTYILYDFAGQYDLQEGDVIKLDDGATQRYHTVLNLAITALDTEAETIQGTADPDAQVDVWPHGFDEVATVQAIAGQDGNWTAHFAGVFDLSAYLGGRSQIRDESGSATAVDWNIPNERIYAQYTDDHIRFEYAAPGSEITFTILDSSDNLLWKGSRPADEDGFAMVSIWEHHQELIPGMHIRVSDGIITKNLLLEPLTMGAIDLDENTLSGTAEPWRIVGVGANNESVVCGDLVTADQDGNWFYDFDDQGCDVTEDMDYYAQVMDSEDDTTEVFPAFIDGGHDYDTGDVPSWACNAGGWAVDSDDRSRDLQIRVLADGEADENVVEMVTAGNEAGLVGVCGPDGACGYEVNLWGDVSPYVEHQIFVQAYDEETMQWFNLNGTPRPLTCRSNDIYIYDPATGETNQLTNLPDTDEYDPSWSPDGKFIAHEVIGGDSFEIYITHVASGGSYPLTGSDGGLNPAWSPNGWWIAFDRIVVGDPNIYVVPFSGGQRRLVAANAISPSWSPSSFRLVYQDQADGSLKSGGLLGGPVFRVADHGELPAWSPDGQWIAYQKDGDIWKVRVNPIGKPIGQPVQLTSLPTWEDMPTWSADSQMVLFHTGLNRDVDLWQVPAAGGEPTWLTGAPGFGDYDPASAPDGGTIAYASFSPNGQAARPWVAAYTADLPGGSLADGTYPYHFEFEWTSPDQGSFSGQGGEFEVSSAAPLYDGYVLLRGIRELAGMDTPDGLVCEDISAFHPDQAARFLIGWLTETEMGHPDALDHFASLTGWAVWGDGMSAELQPHEIWPFTSLDGWYEYVCSYSR